MTKTVLITGASSGFGRAAALLFQSRGWNVSATMRSPDKEALWTKPAGLFTPRLDVTDRDSIKAAIDETLAIFGNIDVLINNAGFGLLGPLEGATHDDIRRQFDTNILGVISAIQLILPSMRAAGGGVIVNVSSVGGRVTFPLYSSYHATKFALEGLTEALQYELQGHRIRVKLVEPGASKTNFSSSSLTETPHPAYQALMTGMRESAEKISGNAPGPEKVAEAIYRAATDGSTRLRYPVLDFPYLQLRQLIGARAWSGVIKAIARRLAVAGAQSA